MADESKSNNENGDVRHMTSVSQCHACMEGLYAGMKWDGQKILRIKCIAKGILRLFWIGYILIASAIFVLFLHNAFFPYQWQLPKGIPLVLGLTTDMGVEEVIDVLCTKYSVEISNVSVNILHHECVFFKRVPLRHGLIVENFSAPGLAERKLECRFLKNRLMYIRLVPKLTEGECKTLLGEDYSKYAVQPHLFSLFSSEPSSGSHLKKKRESDLEDQLVLINDRHESLIFSKLLCHAYFDWMKWKHD